MECTQCNQEVTELVKVNDSKLCIDCVGSDKYQTLKEFGQVIKQDIVTDSQYKTAVCYIENLSNQISRLEKEIIKYKEVVSKYNKQKAERLVKEISSDLYKFVHHFNLDTNSFADSDSEIDLTEIELIIKTNDYWSHSELKKTDWENCLIYEINWSIIDKLGLYDKFQSIKPCDCYPERSEYVNELYAMWNEKSKRWIIYGFSDLWKYPPDDSDTSGISMVCEEMVIL